MLSLSPVPYPEYCVELWNGIVRIPVRVLLKPTLRVVPCFEGVPARPYPTFLTVEYDGKQIKIPFQIATTGFAVQLRVYTKRESCPNRGVFGWTRCGDGAFTGSETRSLKTSSFANVATFPTATLSGVSTRTVTLNIPPVANYELSQLAKLPLPPGIELRSATPYAPCSVETTERFSPHIMAFDRGPAVTERWVRDRSLEVLAVRGHVQFPEAEHERHVIAAQVLLIHTNTRPYVRDSVIGFSGSEMVTPDSDEPTLAMGLPGDCEDTAMSTYQICRTILTATYTDPIARTLQSIVRELGQPMILFADIQYGSYKSCHAFCVMKGREITILDGVLDATPYYKHHTIAPAKLQVIKQVQEKIKGRDIPWIWSRYHTKYAMGEDGLALYRRCYVAFFDSKLHAIMYNGTMSCMFTELEHAEFKPIHCPDIDQEHDALEMVERPFVCFDGMYDGYLDRPVPRPPPPPTTKGNRLLVCAYDTTVEKAVGESWGLEVPQVFPYGFGIALVFHLHMDIFH